MSDTEFDDGQEVRRTPPRAAKAAPAAKKVVAKRRNAAPKRRTIPEIADEEVRAEAPMRRNAPRPAPREAARDIPRSATRTGAVIAVGHNGETLTRRRTSVGDKFEIPAHFIPKGWSYQWNAVTVLNQGINEIIRGDLTMYENGWRAVPASRHPGHWTPHDHEGAIVVDGLRLEERPLSLTQEAREEDTVRAKALVRDRTDALRMTQKELPGSEVARRRNGALNMGMRMEIDPGLDIPLPQHQLDNGE